MYDHYLSNFGRPPVSDDICKDSATRHPRSGRRRFLKVFPIQMHREANLTLPYKGQMSIYDLYFSNFGRPSSTMIQAKIQPQSILGLGEEDF